MPSNQLEIVRFPGDPDDAKAQDLAGPVVGLLHDLSLLGSTQELNDSASALSVLSGPAPSVAILEAGATALTKAWSTAMAAGITATAIVAAVKGAWGDEHDIVRVAILSGASVVLAVLALAIGIIVSTDVRARAAGAAAVIQARADIATTFLTLAKRDAMGQRWAQLSSGDGANFAPAISSMVATQLTGQSPQAPGVTLTVVAMGTDDAGRTWYHVIQSGQPPRWVPATYLSAADPN